MLDKAVCIVSVRGEVSLNGGPRKAPTSQLLTYSSYSATVTSRRFLTSGGPGMRTKEFFTKKESGTVVDDLGVGQSG